MRTVIALLVVVMLTTACGGGGTSIPDPGPGPTPEPKGTASVTWSAIDARTWTVEAWQPGGTPDTDIILWTESFQGPGTLDHEFEVDQYERIRFRYRSGNRVGADQHSLVGPGAFQFTISPRFVQ